MKFQLKSIAAAAALALFAGHAAAAIQPINNASGSELVFYVFDEVTKTSYVQDLGVAFNSFLPGTAASTSPFSATLGNTAWNSYVSSVGGDTSNSYWGVAAVIRPTVAGGSYGLISTVRDGETAVGQNRGAAATGISTFFGNMVTSANAFTGGTTADNVSYFSNATTSENWASAMRHNFGGKTFLTDNLIGTSAAFTYVDITTATAGITDYSGTWSFDGSNLTYAVAAVPEPETYAMMLAGLMLVGGIARRRRNAGK